MKCVKYVLASLAAIFTVGATAPVQAQVPAAGPPGWNAAMTKLFGDIKAFTAKAEMHALDKTGKETITLLMGFALLDGNVRLDIDMAQMKGPQVPASAAAQLKQLSMDRMVAVVMPAKKSMYLIYPGLQAYVDMPLPEEVALADKDYKIAKTKIGNEAVDGHSCVKHKVVMTDAKGQKAEAIVWNATDLKDFPLQMQMVDKESTVVMRYKEIQIAKPDAKQFVAPAGYMKHADMSQLMMAAMQKQMGSQGKKK